MKFTLSTTPIFLLTILFIILHLQPNYVTHSITPSIHSPSTFINNDTYQQLSLPDDDCSVQFQHCAISGRIYAQIMSESIYTQGTESIPATIPELISITLTLNTYPSRYSKLITLETYNAANPTGPSSVIESFIVNQYNHAIITTTPELYDRYVFKISDIDFTTSLPIDSSKQIISGSFFDVVSPCQYQQIRYSLTCLEGCTITNECQCPDGYFGTNCQYILNLIQHTLIPQQLTSIFALERNHQFTFQLNYHPNAIPADYPPPPTPPTITTASTLNFPSEGNYNLAIQQDSINPTLYRATVPSALTSSSTMNGQMELCWDSLCLFKNFIFYGRKCNIFNDFGLAGTCFNDGTSSCNYVNNIPSCSCRALYHGPKCDFYMELPFNPSFPSGNEYVKLGVGGGASKEPNIVITNKGLPNEELRIKKFIYDNGDLVYWVQAPLLAQMPKDGIIFNPTISYNGVEIRSYAFQIKSTTECWTNAICDDNNTISCEVISTINVCICKPGYFGNRCQIYLGLLIDTDENTPLYFGQELQWDTNSLPSAITLSISTLSTKDSYSSADNRYTAGITSSSQSINLPLLIENSRGFMYRFMPSPNQLLVAIFATETGIGYRNFVRFAIMENCSTLKTAWTPTIPTGHALCHEPTTNACNTQVLHVSPSISQQQLQCICKPLWFGRYCQSLLTIPFNLYAARSQLSLPIPFNVLVETIDGYQPISLADITIAVYNANPVPTIIKNNQNQFFLQFTTDPANNIIAISFTISYNNGQGIQWYEKNSGLVHIIDDVSTQFFTTQHSLISQPVCSNNGSGTITATPLIRLDQSQPNIQCTCSITSFDNRCGSSYYVPPDITPQVQFFRSDDKYTFYVQSETFWSRTIQSNNNNNVQSHNPLHIHYRWISNWSNVTAIIEQDPISPLKYYAIIPNIESSVTQLTLYDVTNNILIGQLNFDADNIYLNECQQAQPLWSTNFCPSYGVCSVDTSFSCQQPPSGGVYPCLMSNIFGTRCQWRFRLEKHVKMENDRYMAIPQSTTDDNAATPLATNIIYFEQIDLLNEQQSMSIQSATASPPLIIPSIDQLARTITITPLATASGIITLTVQCTVQGQDITLSIQFEIVPRCVFMYYLIQEYHRKPFPPTLDINPYHLHHETGCTDSNYLTPTFLYDTTTCAISSDNTIIRFGPKCGSLYQIQSLFPTHITTLPGSPSTITITNNNEDILMVYNLRFGTTGTSSSTRIPYIIPRGESITTTFFYPPIIPNPTLLINTQLPEPLDAFEIPLISSNQVVSCNTGFTCIITQTESCVINSIYNAFQCQCSPGYYGPTCAFQWPGTITASTTLAGFDNTNQPPFYWGQTIIISTPSLPSGVTTLQIKVFTSPTATPHVLHFNSIGGALSFTIEQPPNNLQLFQYRSIAPYIQFIPNPPSNDNDIDPNTYSITTYRLPGTDIVSQCDWLAEHQYSSLATNVPFCVLENTSQCNINYISSTNNNEHVCECTNTLHDIFQSKIIGQGLQELRMSFGQHCEGTIIINAMQYLYPGQKIPIQISTDKRYPTPIFPKTIELRTSLTTTALFSIGWSSITKQNYMIIPTDISSIIFKPRRPIYQTDSTSTVFGIYIEYDYINTNGQSKRQQLISTTTQHQFEIVDTCYYMSLITHINPCAYTDDYSIIPTSKCNVHLEDSNTGLYCECHDGWFGERCQFRFRLNQEADQIYSQYHALPIDYRTKLILEQFPQTTINPNAVIPHDIILRNDPLQHITSLVPDINNEFEFTFMKTYGQTDPEYYSISTINGTSYTRIHFYNPSTQESFSTIQLQPQCSFFTDPFQCDQLYTTDCDIVNNRCSCTSWAFGDKCEYIVHPSSTYPISAPNYYQPNTPINILFALDTPTITLSIEEAETQQFTMQQVTDDNTTTTPIFSTLQQSLSITTPSTPAQPFETPYSLQITANGNTYILDQFLTYDWCSTIGCDTTNTDYCRFNMGPEVPQCYCKPNSWGTNCTETIVLNSPNFDLHKRYYFSPLKPLEIEVTSGWDIGLRFYLVNKFNVNDIIGELLYDANFQLLTYTISTTTLNNLSSNSLSIVVTWPDDIYTYTSTPFDLTIIPIKDCDYVYLFDKACFTPGLSTPTSCNPSNISNPNSQVCTCNVQNGYFGRYCENKVLIQDDYNDDNSFTRTIDTYTGMTPQNGHLYMGMNSHVIINRHYLQHSANKGLKQAYPNAQLNNNYMAHFDVYFLSTDNLIPVAAQHLISNRIAYNPAFSFNGNQYDPTDEITELRQLQPLNAAFLGLGQFYIHRWYSVNGVPASSPFSITATQFNNPDLSLSGLIWGLNPITVAQPVFTKSSRTIYIQWNCPPRHIQLFRDPIFYRFSLYIRNTNDELLLTDLIPDTTQITLPKIQPDVTLQVIKSYLTTNTNPTTSQSTSMYWTRQRIVYSQFIDGSPITQAVDIEIPSYISIPANSNVYVFMSPNEIPQLMSMPDDGNILYNLIDISSSFTSPGNGQLFDYCEEFGSTICPSTTTTRCNKYTKSCDCIQNGYVYINGQCIEDIPTILPSTTTTTPFQNCALTTLCPLPLIPSPHVCNECIAKNTIDRNLTRTTMLYFDMNSIPTSLQESKLGFFTLLDIELTTSLGLYQGDIYHNNANIQPIYPNVGHVKQYDITLQPYQLNNCYEYIRTYPLSHGRGNIISYDKIIATIYMQCDSTIQLNPYIQRRFNYLESLLQRMFITPTSVHDIRNQNIGYAKAGEFIPWSNLQSLQSITFTTMTNLFTPFTTTQTSSLTTIPFQLFYPQSILTDGIRTIRQPFTTYCKSFNTNNNQLLPCPSPRVSLTSRYWSTCSSSRTKSLQPICLDINNQQYPSSTTSWCKGINYYPNYPIVTEITSPCTEDNPTTTISNISFKSTTIISADSILSTSTPPITLNSDVYIILKWEYIGRDNYTIALYIDNITSLIDITTQSTTLQETILANGNSIYLRSFPAKQQFARFKIPNYIQSTTDMTSKFRLVLVQNVNIRAESVGFTINNTYDKCPHCIGSNRQCSLTQSTAPCLPPPNQYFKTGLIDITKEQYSCHPLCSSCNTDTFQCQCTTGWKGDYCQISTCPQNHNYPQPTICNGHGYYKAASANQCNIQSCTCTYPYDGPLCEQCILPCDTIGTENVENCSKCNCKLGHSGQFCQYRALYGSIVLERIKPIPQTTNNYIHDHIQSSTMKASMSLSTDSSSTTLTTSIPSQSLSLSNEQLQLLEQFYTLQQQQQIQNGDVLNQFTTLALKQVTIDLAITLGLDPNTSIESIRAYAIITNMTLPETYFNTNIQQMNDENNNNHNISIDNVGVETNSMNLLSIPFNILQSRPSSSTTRKMIPVTNQTTILSFRISSSSPSNTNIPSSTNSQVNNNTESVISMNDLYQQWNTLKTDFISSPVANSDGLKELTDQFGAPKRVLDSYDPNCDESGTNNIDENDNCPTGNNPYEDPLIPTIPTTKKGLSTGAIIGIILGITLPILLFVLIAILCWYSSKHKIWCFKPSEHEQQRNKNRSGSIAGTEMSIATNLSGVSSQSEIDDSTTTKGVYSGKMSTDQSSQKTVDLIPIAPDLEDPLPENWTKWKHKDTDEIFFINSETMVSQRHAPGTQAKNKGKWF